MHDRLDAAEGLSVIGAHGVPRELVGVGVVVSDDDVGHRVGDDVGLQAADEVVIAGEHVDEVLVLLDPPRDGHPVRALNAHDRRVVLHPRIGFRQGADDPPVLVDVGETRDDRLGGEQRALPVRLPPEPVLASEGVVGEVVDIGGDDADGRFGRTSRRCPWRDQTARGCRQNGSDHHALRDPHGASVAIGILRR